MTKTNERMFYRKEKLRGACWEYQIEGGWVSVATPIGERQLLRHRFAFYRPRDVEVRTPGGVEVMSRTGAEQWFFPDRWFSLLRFLAPDNRTVGYYVNFSLPLSELRTNYYRDLDLELDLWLDPDGTATELDRDEYDAEVASERLPAAWAAAVDRAYAAVSEAAAASVAEHGPDLDRQCHPEHGVPGFILSA